MYAIIGRGTDISVTASPRAAECLTSPEQIQLVDTTARKLYAIIVGDRTTWEDKQEFIRCSSLLLSMGLVYYINEKNEPQYNRTKGVVLHHHAARARERLANINRVADKLFSETQK